MWKTEARTCQHFSFPQYRVLLSTGSPLLHLKELGALLHTPCDSLNVRTHLRHRVQPQKNGPDGTLDKVQGHRKG